MLKSAARVQHHCLDVIATLLTYLQTMGETLAHIVRCSKGFRDDGFIVATGDSLTINLRVSSKFDYIMRSFN